MSLIDLLYGDDVDNDGHLRLFDVLLLVKYVAVCAIDPQYANAQVSWMLVNPIPPFLRGNLS